MADHTGSFFSISGYSFESPLMLKSSAWMRTRAYGNLLIKKHALGAKVSQAKLYSDIFRIIANNGLTVLYCSQSRHLKCPGNIRPKRIKASQRGYK